MGYNSQGDPLVVRAYDVYLMLKPQLDAWEEEHREAKRNGYQRVGGWSTVAQEVGVSPRRVKQALLEQQWIAFGKADAWLTAMGLHVRGLTTYPNPRWSLEKWVAWNEENGGCIG